MKEVALRRGKAAPCILFLVALHVYFRFVLGRTQTRGEEQPVRALVPSSLYVRLALFLEIYLFIEVERYLMASQHGDEPAYTRLT
jgi:hypothetical protein